MSAAKEWMPMRWPAGWRDPSYLTLLKGSPINCLLMPGADAGADLKAVREQALKLGFACLATAGEESQRAAPEEIRIVPRAKLDWKTPDAILAVSECVWPSLASQAAGAEAGPTGVPWVDSNGWFIQLAQARAPEKTFWLFYDPPEKTVLRPESYALAVTDAEAYGARWAITLDDATAADRARAAAALSAAGRALSFFEARRAWRLFVPRAVLGVLSDFSGPNQFLSEEILNLLARRPLPFRVLDKARGAALSLQGLKAIIYPDQEPPEAGLRDRLLAFARGGGLLITGPQWPAPRGAPGPGDVYGRFQVFPAGKGRLAIAKEELGDPYLVALDAHLLLSHRHDLIRLWNGGSLNAHYTASPDGRSALVQLLNYATRRAAHPVTLGLAGRYRTAVFWEQGAESGRPIDIIPATQGIELPLPEFAVYAAIELGGKS